MLRFCPNLSAAGGVPFAQLGDDELRTYRCILQAKFHWPPY
jgi:hypothetical protein